MNPKEDEYQIKILSVLLIQVVMGWAYSIVCVMVQTNCCFIWKSLRHLNCSCWFIVNYQ